MKQSRTGFSFEISENDLKLIRDSIEIWITDSNISEVFDGGSLYDYFEKWWFFVETDWDDWDISEYDHDIECRNWIQIAIENSTSRTSKLLEDEVSIADDIFTRNMKPYIEDRKKLFLKAPFKLAPYFWETHTIHKLYQQDESSQGVKK